MSNKTSHIKISIFLLFVLFFNFYNISYADSIPRCYSSQGANGAVSCGHPLAAQTAIQMLKIGGNAVDAAVAAAFVLGVVDFTNSGIGGEGFALICDPSGKIIAIDGSTRRPSKDVKLEYQCHISLPTNAEMLLKMQRLYGDVTADKIIKPAIALCDEGFEVSPYLEKIVSERIEKITDERALKLIKPKNIPLKAGQILKQPLLAQTLRNLSKDNGISFYYGKEADQTLSDMLSKGSSYTKPDFIRYKSRLCQPVKLSYKNYELYGNPHPSSSALAMRLAVELLNSRQALLKPMPVELLKILGIYRRILDVKHHSFASFYNKSQEFFSYTLPDEKQKSVDAKDSNTTHICVWDKDNRVVSLTLTLGNHFGTGQLAPGGFFYANCLRTYSKNVVKYPANYPNDAGSITSKSPIIVKKSGEPWLAIGGAGSDRIITNTATIIARLIKGHNLEESLDAPRFFMEYNKKVFLEGINQETKPKTNNFREEYYIKHYNNQVKSLYSNTEIKPYLHDYFGLISAIQKTSGELKAVGDKHRDGSCSAY